MKRRGSFFLLLGTIGFTLLVQLNPCLADKRVALVVGNSNYKNTPALANPINDASDVYQSLKAVGFDVKLELDVTKREMDAALEQFARASASADTSLFYYAGHGMQYQGRNYIMPVDADLSDDVSVHYEMTSVYDVKAAIERSDGVRIMVLDACRSNPLAQRFARSITSATRDIPNVRGFAPAEKMQGMVVVYATQADEVADDGVGRNSPFSSAFLKEIKEPGLEIGTMFRRIGEDVYKATNGRQSPELSISMLPEYYLNQTETDQAVWARIRDAADAETIREFINRYPNSFYAPDAKARLELLDDAKRRAAADELANQRQVTAAAEAERLKQQQAESERTAAESRAREKDLATKLAAAEAEKKKVASELANQVKAQREADERLKTERAKADDERKQREATLQAEIDNQKTTASQLEKDRQLLDAIAKDREKQKADDQAAADQERERKEAADRDLRAQLDRAQALKDEIARLEQEAEQAQANVRADEKKAADAQRATEAQKSAALAEKPTALTTLQPTGQGGLAPDQVALVQPIRSELRRLGCYLGADSEWNSPAMKLGVAKFAQYAKLASSPEFPSASLLEDLSQRHGRVCPSECSVLELEVDGRCIAKSCGPGQFLSRSGACLANAPVVNRPPPSSPSKRQTALIVAPATRQAPPRAPRKVSEQPKGHCFTFNGSQYCE